MSANPPASSSADHKDASSKCSRAEPFLHLGDIGIVIHRDGRSRRPESMHADFPRVHSELERIHLNHVFVNRMPRQWLLRNTLLELSALPPLLAILALLAGPPDPSEQGGIVISKILELEFPF